MYYDDFHDMVRLYFSRYFNKDTRKLILFNCACLNMAGHLLGDLVYALKNIEEFADNRFGYAALDNMLGDIRKYIREQHDTFELNSHRYTKHIIRNALCTLINEISTSKMLFAVNAPGRSRQWEILTTIANCMVSSKTNADIYASESPSATYSIDNELSSFVPLFIDIFNVEPSPFVPLFIDTFNVEPSPVGEVMVGRITGFNRVHNGQFQQSWIEYNDYAVLNMAKSIYDEKRFDALPILADALEDAGCDDRIVLDHCRSSLPHAKGCWALDLLLRK